MSLELIKNKLKIQNWKYGSVNHMTVLNPGLTSNTQIYIYIEFDLMEVAKPTNPLVLRKISSRPQKLWACYEFHEIRVNSLYSYVSRSLS